MVAASACVLFLAPGLLVVQVMRAADNFGAWVRRGFAITVVGVSGVASVVQSVAGATVSGQRFVFLLAVLSVARPSDFVRHQRLSP